MKGYEWNLVLHQVHVEFTLTFCHIEIVDGHLRKELFNMAKSIKNKHMTLEDRKIIETGIINGSTKVSIADTIGKDPSTVGKEVLNRRIKTHRFSLPLECSSYTKCTHGRNCKLECPDYVPFKCSRRDRSPGACNGCSNYTHCRFDKFTYRAEASHNEYRETLVDSREGVNLTSSEAKELGEKIKPYLEKGQSPYQIIENHPEIGICEKTLYNYINGDVFRVAGVTIMDLRRKVSRKASKKEKKNALKKREDRKYLKGREYKDFKVYIEEHPNANIVEMDTVYNDVENGPFIQTFKFLKYGFMFAFYHERRTSEEMLKGINLLEQILGNEAFKKEAEVLLTDRGSEFVKADEFEQDEDGTKRTRIFYCDPMASGQKGSLENNHIELRYILPKGCDLRALGLTSQKKLNLVLSHINSFPKEKLNGKSAIELLDFLAPQIAKKFFDFGISKIDRDEVVLKPYLLKQ